ncbi:unnamed protein product [Pieris macdunnoughi]|nr:unnamed protein product [Pieris macdunnoughi]
MKVIDLEIELNESSLILSEILKISDGQDLSYIKKSPFLELQKSGKVVDRLDKCRFSRSHNDLLNVGEKPQINAQKLTRKITDLTKEIEIKNSKIIEQQRSISILEEALRENNNIAEFEQLLAVIRSKDERIEELENILNKSGDTRKFYKDKRILKLEEALKESILIAAEREKVFYEEEKRRIEAITKMKKMEQRLKSLQNASVMNYAILRHLSNVIKDLLEEAVSAKDSEIAELELKGVLDENATNICESLKLERDRMLNRLKLENEKLVEFQKVTNITSEESSLPILSDDMTSADNQLVWEEDIPATVL